MAGEHAGQRAGEGILTVTAVSNRADCQVNTADRIRSDSICSVHWAFSSVGNSCNCLSSSPSIRTYCNQSTGLSCTTEYADLWDNC